MRSKLSRLFQVLVTSPLVLACGLLPADAPDKLAETAWPAAVQCAEGHIPELITDVTEVLLRGGTAEEWEAVGRKHGEQGVRDLLCATEQVIEDWGKQAQSGSLSEESATALQHAQDYLKATGTKVE